MFSDVEADDNRRPDILIRNPYGGGSQIIVDAAVVGFLASMDLPEPTIINLNKLSSRVRNTKYQSMEQ